MKKRKTDEPREEMPEDVSNLTGWKRARKRLDPVTAKIPSRRITINIDEDIIAIFKAEALQGGLPYQVAINQALRSHLREREMSDEQRAVRTVLIALDDPTIRKRIRGIR